MTKPENDDPRREDSRRCWDEQADAFDDQPDHGLREPVVRAAWTELLRGWLPEPGLSVLDTGCGTGSLSVGLASLGHRVTGIDLSPAMIARAREKAAAHGLEIEFQVLDAADPALPERRFDALLCRHLLWALPEPEQVLQRWLRLLKPGGRMILIEGFWHTGAGLHAADLLKQLPSSLKSVSLQSLSKHPDLWGGPVSDERYALVADL